MPTATVEGLDRVGGVASERSRRDASLGTFQIDAGPRRSPSACLGMLKKNKAVHGEEMAEMKGINLALAATNANLETRNQRLTHTISKLEARKTQLKDGCVTYWSPPAAQHTIPRLLNIRSPRLLNMRSPPAVARDGSRGGPSGPWQRNSDAALPIGRCRSVGSGCSSQLQPGRGVGCRRVGCRGAVAAGAARIGAAIGFAAAVASAAAAAAILTPGAAPQAAPAVGAAAAAEPAGRSVGCLC